MLGITTELEKSSWDSAIDWSVKIENPLASFEPLFQRLDADEILKHEQSIVENSSEKSNPGHEVKGGKKEMKNMKEEPLEGIEYLDFDTFMKVDLRVGVITSVEDHPNADRLYVIRIDDGSGQERTICAGIKSYYSVDELLQKSIVFVSNLKPRALRGVNSQGMMLAADDGNGGVRLVTIDGEIAAGSRVR
mgnify:FL=1